MEGVMQYLSGLRSMEERNSRTGSLLPSTTEALNRKNMTNGTKEQFKVISKILIIYMTAFKVPFTSSQRANLSGHQGQVLIVEVAEPQEY